MASSVTVKPFVLHELDQLRDELRENGMKISDKGDLVGALVLAARRSPIEAVAAVVGTYWERESAEVKRGSGTS